MERGDTLRNLALATTPLEFERRFSDLLLLRELDENERASFEGGTSTAVQSFSARDAAAVSSGVPRPRADSLESRLGERPGHFVLYPLRTRGGDAGMVRVGRSKASDIHLDHASISKLHACFRRDERGRWTLHDMQSRNGTTRDDVVVPTAEPGLLVRAGMRIVFGAVTTELVAGRTLFRA